MRRKLTLLLLIFMCILTAAPAFAQAQPASRMTNPWWFGVNFGATWQTSDFKTVPGFGWGLTLSKMSRYRENRALWWGARFRFLDGVNYGEDYTRFRGITNDPALNGNDSIGNRPNYVANGGYVFSNYRTRLDELAFELQIGSNALRKQGILLYGWGGLGITKAVTKINQRDASGNLYNYSLIDSTGNRDVVKGQLHNLWDDSYETVANGSEKPEWTFMPSAGLGIGKTFNNRFGVALEHKVTFTLDNLIDGRRYDNANIKDSKNDWYHYTGVKLIWRFRPETERTLPPPPPNNPTNPNTYTQQPPPNNPNPNNPTVINTQQPPNVRITTPSQNPYYTSNANGQLTAQVTNVSSAGQIRLTVNGYQNSNFSWNQNTQMLSFNYNLAPGNNSFVITATNQAGSDTETETIILQQQMPAEMPPQVTITNPPSNPFTSTVSSMTINATVLNVLGASNIQVRRNGSPITNFTYNGTTKQVTFTGVLQNGNNLFEVVGTNNVGSATGSVNILYSTVTPPPTGQPPVVTITNPSSCPTQSKVQNMTITATVLNVNSTAEITVTFNGQTITGYNWNGATKQLSFPAVLTPGNNTLMIGAANAYGKDVKNCQITYKASLPAPLVTITNPTSNPYNTPNAPFALTANVINVNSQNEITVTMNNQPFTAFSYNMSSKVLTLNTTLNQGTSVFTITASNAGGTDSKSQTVIYTPAAPAMQPPVVTITNPTANPYITNSSNVFVAATVLNVTSSSQITVSAVGRGNIPFNFNAASHILTFNDFLQAGARNYTISATNAAGSDSKSTTIKVVQQSGGTGSTGSTGTPNDPVKNPGGTGGGTISGGGSGGVSTGGSVGGGVSGGGSVGGGASTGGSGSTGSSGSTGGSGNVDPVITLISPSSTNHTTSNTSLQVTAQIVGVSDASGISVRVNGLRLMNFNYSNGTLTFTANLNSGSNTIEMKAQNSIGFATKTINVTVGSSGKTGSGGGKGKTTTTVGGSTKSGSTGSSGSQKNPEPRKTGTTTTGDGKGNTSTPKTPTPAPAPTGKGGSGKGG